MIDNGAINLNVNGKLGTGRLTVEEGGVLAGQNNIITNSLVYIEAGGTLVPGNYSRTEDKRVGKMTFEKSLVVKHDGMVNINIRDAKNYSSSRTWLVCEGLLSFQGVLNVALNPTSTYTPAAGDSIIVWEAMSFSHSNTYAKVNLPDVSQYNLAWDTSDLFKAKGILRLQTATGIDEVKTEEEETKPAGIYTISGQYMGDDASALKPGIYVINGEKIYIK